MSRKFNRHFAYPLVFLALVLALLVAENLPGNAQASAEMGQVVATHDADLAGLPVMYE